MHTIRWGIIGCGDVTEHKSGPALQKATNSQLVAVMRRSGDMAQSYARRHGVSRWYDTAEALIQDQDVDAVYIATPPSSHREYALMCAGAGKPAYVEKPMALNHHECLDMIQAFSAAGVKLFVAYYRRSLPRFLKIKELIDSGAIGDVRFINIKLTKPPLQFADDNADIPWRVIPSVSGGGLFVDLAPHILDFLDFVFGPVAEVGGFAQSHDRRYPAEDLVSATFRFASGVLGVGSWCFTGFDHEDYTEIVGTKGKIGFSTFDQTPISLTASSGVSRFDIVNPAHIQQPFIQSIIDDLNGTGCCPGTAESAARTSWVMDQILQNLSRSNG